LVKVKKSDAWVRDDGRVSRGPCNTFAEGDNLDVLATLPEASYGLIYIDPPYNTGSDFAYHDDFKGRHGDGLTGRHAAWAAMMRPRLEAGRRVLADTGAIFVSIDDHEVAHLRLLMDEVYGEQGFLAQIVVNLNAKGRQLGSGFATSHEYVLAYAKDARQCVLDASSADLVVEADFPLVADDGRRYRRLPLRNTNKRFNPLSAPTLHFAIWGNPETGEVRTAPFEGAVEIKPVFGDGSPAVWRWSRPLIDERPDDLVCRRVRGATGGRIDVFQRDWRHPAAGARRKKLRTIWLAEEIGSTDTAVAELKEILGHVFESPKPTGLVRRILDTMPPDVRVLDYFAGSGTTGHAVALANAADGGRRTCLSVNNAEPVRPGSNADLAGYRTVADITRARLRAVAERVGGGYAESDSGGLLQGG
jgi:adenine-specific DNA-methyltransferase